MSRCKLLKVPKGLFVFLFVWLSFYFRVVFVCVVYLCVFCVSVKGLG